MQTYQTMHQQIAEHKFGKPQKKESYGLYYNNTLVYGHVIHYAMCKAEEKRLLKYTNQFKKENFQIK